MNNKPEVLVVIPARGGSKRVPRKNVRPLNGKPLIAYAIEAAKNSSLVGRVVVTTDDEEIKEVAKTHGAEVPFMRPADMATDTARVIPPLQHAVTWLKENEGYSPDIFVLIQPTVPGVNKEDIDAAIQTLIDTKTNTCVSVKEISEPPEWMYTKSPEGVLTSWGAADITTRSQDLPKRYILAGAVYAVWTPILMEKGVVTDVENTSAIVIPRERATDIDEEVDFTIAEALLKTQKK